MKPLVLFFLFLCFELLGGHDHVNASSHSFKICCASTKTIEKTQSETAYSKQDYVISRSDGFGWDSSPLISVDNENEDEDDLIKKHTLLAKCFVAFYYTFISSYVSKGNVEPLSFSKHLAYLGTHKYIAQRVLRI